MSEEILSMSTSKDLRDTTTLSELFDNAFDSFNDLNKTEEPTNSPQIQSKIRKIMNMLEDATKLVSIVNMFSENESYEEVATENIKYFLLPALLGTLTTKICGSSDRMYIVNVAEIYFLDFLKRIKSYGIIDIEIPEPKSEDDTNNTSIERTQSNSDMIIEMVSRRNTKLQRYKEQKELEARLDMLKKILSNPNADDEAKREYFFTLIKLYGNQTIEELNSLAAEKPILEHMQKIGRTETMKSQVLQKSKVPTPKLQPIIITRNELQRKVYGAGYPSLPVLTVQEFYEKRVKDGDWPDYSQCNQINSKCLQDLVNNSTSDNTQEDTEAAETEKKIEKDDPELLEQTRAMDEYKDMHKRGWGNRANRS